MPQETVQRYGLPMMRALHHGHLPSVRFAGATMPKISGPSAPRYSFAEGGLATGGMPAPKVSMRVMNYLDMDQLAQALSRSDAFEKTVVNTVVGNGGAIRSGWDD